MNYLQELKKFKLVFAYHPRDLAHLSELLAERPGSSFLHAAGEIDASPVVHDTPVNHFLNKKPDENQVLIDFIICIMTMGSDLVHHIPLTHLRQAFLLLPGIVVLELHDVNISR